MTLELDDSIFEPVTLDNHNEISARAAPLVPGSMLPGIKNPHDEISGYHAAFVAGTDADRAADRLRKSHGEKVATIRALEKARAGLVERAKAGEDITPTAAGDAARAIEDAVADADLVAEALRLAEIDCTACRNHMHRVLSQHLGGTLVHLRELAHEAAMKVAAATRELNAREHAANYIMSITTSQEKVTLEQLVAVLGIRG